MLHEVIWRWVSLLDVWLLYLFIKSSEYCILSVWVFSMSSEYIHISLQYEFSMSSEYIHLSLQYEFSMSSEYIHIPYSMSSVWVVSTYIYPYSMSSVSLLSHSYYMQSCFAVSSISLRYSKIPPVLHSILLSDLSLFVRNGQQRGPVLIPADSSSFAHASQSPLSSYQMFVDTALGRT